MEIHVVKLVLVGRAAVEITIQAVAELFNLIIGGTVDHLTYRAKLNGLTQLGQIVQCAPLQAKVHRKAVRHGGQQVVHDKAATAFTRLDKPVHFEGLQGLSHGGAADTEYLRQFTFRWEAVTNLEFSGYDCLLDLTDDIFEVPLLMNGCEQNIFTLSRYVMVKIITRKNL